MHRADPYLAWAFHHSSSMAPPLERASICMGLAALAVVLYVALLLLEMFRGGLLASSSLDSIQVTVLRELSDIRDL